MRIVRIPLVFALLGGALAGCGDRSADGRPQVAASIFPLYEAAAKIGGKQVHAINLLPDDPYGALSVKSQKQLRDADLAIILGGGYQPEIDKIAAERKAPTLRILGEGEFHAAGDVNVWLDPRNMALIAERVRDALAAIDPEIDGKFVKNLKRYQIDIAKVDADYVRTLATCKTSVLMVENPDFRPLTHRYGLTQLVTSPLANPTDPTVESVIDQSGVTTVFASSIPSLREATRIRDQYGVRVAVLSPITTQTDQARRGGASYRVVMELNLDALREALDCEPKEHKT